VYSDSFSREFLAPAAKEKGVRMPQSQSGPKIAKYLDTRSSVRSSFERLSGAVRNFVRNGKERLFCQISD
jgi:hypothetical protein